jgi:hypothetical protein
MADDVTNAGQRIRQADPTDDHSADGRNAPPTLAQRANAHQIAAHEVQHIVLVTGSFVSTVTTLLASALGFVTALAWNTAVQGWLQTVKVFNLNNQVAKQFSYAVTVTIFAVVAIGILGLLTRRVRGQNLLTLQQQQK